MAIKFILKKYTDREIRVIVQDQDKHSIPNLITKLATRKPGVTFAGYILEHPIVSYPEIVIVTDGSKDPLDILREVISDAKNIAIEFLEVFDKALLYASKERV